MATPWDAVFKEIFAKWLEGLGAAVQTQVETGRLPRTIDVVGMTDAAVRARLAKESPFDYFQRHNIVEFKSPRDPLTPDEYKLIVARAYLFLQKVGEDDLRNLTVTVISATKPRRVLTQVPYLVKFQKEAPGRYRSDDKLSLYVLVTSELPMEERNRLLLLFTTGEKRDVVLREMSARGEKNLLNIAYHLYPHAVSEVSPMSKEFPTLEENIEFFIQDFGAERVVRGLVNLLGREQAEELLRQIAESQPKKRTRRPRQAKNGNGKQQRK
jgi:hypothetical protein